MYDLMSECNVLKDWNEDVKANENQIVDSRVCFQNLMIRIERTHFIILNTSTST